MSVETLNDKVYLVTGGTSGIGEGAAMAFARAGAAGVVFCGRNEERGASVKAALEEAGTCALFVPADMAEEADCRKVVRICDETFGRLDGLVNAAGTSDRGTLDNTTVEQWDWIFAVNVRAPFIMSQESVRVMKRDGHGGAIVNIISMSGHGGQPFLTPYCASKGALANLTKNIAHGLRHDRIRVNGIMLGWADTPGSHVVQRKEGKPADWLLHAEKAQPFGRLVKIRDVANLTTFLVSDRCGVMTGALIDLDQNVMGAYD
jgi:NAD(P)-dependent dehydrogenase (short-subunit alcohol dehydrogenase family)